MKRFKLLLVLTMILAVLSFGTAAWAAERSGTAFWDEEDGWMLEYGKKVYELNFEDADLAKDMEWLWLDAEGVELAEFELEVNFTGERDKNTIFVSTIKVDPDTIDEFKGIFDYKYMELMVEEDDEEVYELIGNLEGLNRNFHDKEIEVQGIEDDDVIFVLSYKIVSDKQDDDKDQDKNNWNKKNNKGKHANFGQLNAYFKQMTKNKSNLQARMNLAKRLQDCYGGKYDFVGLVEILSDDSKPVNKDKANDYIEGLKELYEDLIGEDSELDRQLVSKLAKLYKDRGDKDIKLFIKGKQTQVDVSPVVKNGRSLVPLRVVAEDLGAKVVYDYKTEEIKITAGRTTVELQIDSKIAYLDGDKVNLDVAPTVLNGRTMVPIRFIADAFDVDINWYEGLVSIN